MLEGGPNGDQPVSGGEYEDTIAGNAIVLLRRVKEGNDSKIASTVASHQDANTLVASAASAYKAAYELALDVLFDVLDGKPCNDNTFQRAKKTSILGETFLKSPRVLNDLKNTQRAADIKEMSITEFEKMTSFVKARNGHGMEAIDRYPRAARAKEAREDARLRSAMQAIKIASEEREAGEDVGMGSLTQQGEEDDDDDDDDDDDGASLFMPNGKGARGLDLMSDELDEDFGARPQDCAAELGGPPGAYRQRGWRTP